MYDDQLPYHWSLPIDGAPNFTLAELVRSELARRRGIDNRPGPAAVARLERLARRVLQPIRDRFGPMLVTSGYRCLELNRLVGGGERSHHRLGQAADLRPLRQEVRWVEVLCYVHSSLPYDELVAEYLPHGWMHVAYAGSHRPRRRLLIKQSGRPIRPTTMEELRRRLAQAA